MHLTDIYCHFSLRLGSSDTNPNPTSTLRNAEAVFPKFTELGVFRMSDGVFSGIPSPGVE